MKYASWRINQMKSLMLELYKNVDIPSSPKYELTLSDDESSVFTNDDLRNADWNVREEVFTSLKRRLS